MRSCLEDVVPICWKKIHKNKTIRRILKRDILKQACWGSMSTEKPPIPENVWRANYIYSCSRMSFYFNHPLILYKMHFKRMTRVRFRIDTCTRPVTSESSPGKPDLIGKDSQVHHMKVQYDRKCHSVRNNGLILGKTSHDPLMSSKITGLGKKINMNKNRNTFWENLLMRDINIKIRDSH